MNLRRGACALIGVGRQAVRDATAKAIYDRMFRYLVKRLDKLLNEGTDTTSAPAGAKPNVSAGAGDVIELHRSGRYPCNVFAGSF